MFVYKTQEIKLGNYVYGTAQWQLDTRTCVNGKKRAGKLNEYMPNPHGCPSGFKSVMVRLLPRYKALGYRNSNHSPLCS